MIKRCSYSEIFDMLLILIRWVKYEKGNDIGKVENTRISGNKVLVKPGTKANWRIKSGVPKTALLR